jgi:hypothetical protein
MSRLNDVLIDRYAEHHARVNASVDPRTAAPRDWKAVKMMYGDLIAQWPRGSEILDRRRPNSGCADSGGALWWSAFGWRASACCTRLYIGFVVTRWNKCSSAIFCAVRFRSE